MCASIQKWALAAKAQEWIQLSYMGYLMPSMFSLHSWLQVLSGQPQPSFLLSHRCLLDLPWMWESVDVLHQAASCSCPSLEPAAALPHSTFNSDNICLAWRSPVAVPPLTCQMVERCLLPAHKSHYDTNKLFMSTSKLTSALYYLCLQPGSLLSWQIFWPCRQPINCWRSSSGVKNLVCFW